jgi:hypothetical protein
MNAAIRIAGVTSGVAWGLCLVVMLVLIDRTPVQLSVAALAFIGVPFAFSATAFWLAFCVRHRRRKLIFAFEVFLGLLAACCWVILAAAGGG